MEKGTHSNSHKVQKKEEQQSRQFPLAQPLLPKTLNWWVREVQHWAGVGGKLEPRPEA